jgi:hypothetical protein
MVSNQVIGASTAAPTCLRGRYGEYAKAILDEVAQRDHHQQAQTTPEELTSLKE